MPLPLSNDALSIFPHMSHLRMAHVKDLDQCLTDTPGVKGPKTALALEYMDSGISGQPVPRPFLGGEQTGFHAMPNKGDGIMVALEPKFYPRATFGATRNPSLLDVLQLGESMQRHKDGRIADFMKADGTTTLYSDPAGNTLIADGLTKITGTVTTFIITGKTKTGTFELTNTTVGGSQNLVGTISGTGTGTDPQGGTVTSTVTGTCTVTFPHVWNLVIDGTSYPVALLS
jgi:hypothetical protein